MLSPLWAVLPYLLWRDSRVKNPKSKLYDPGSSIGAIEQSYWIDNNGRN